ncbi:PucR family transcriptional regulator [Streptomyces sp. NPDC054864]
MTPVPGPLLGRILTDLGSTLVEVVVGDPDHTRPVGGVLIHDPQEPAPHLPGAVVLGVGVYGADQVAALVERSAALDAAVVVCRSPVLIDDAVKEAVRAGGVPVLGLTPGASWATVTGLLRTLLSMPEPGAADDPADRLPGDLFALANAAAVLLDGPVTVEDRGGAVLAFSRRQEEGDAARIATVLDRQVPGDKLRVLEERGAFHALYRGDGPVYVEGVAEKPRAAIAVRAGGEILGSIWVVVSEPLSAERELSLREVAKVAALHLLRHRAGEDAEQRLRAHLLATVLEGGAGAPEAAMRLGLAGGPACVLALAVTGGASAPERVADGHRVAKALALHLAAVHPRTATASLGGVTYAILPTDSDEPVLRVAESFLTRLGPRVPAVIGVGRVARRLTELRRSRSDADRVLRVLGSGRSPLQAARFPDVYVASLLVELADRVAAEDGLPDGPVVRLRAYDAEHNTGLTETLEAWLATFGDVITAAAAVHIHPNTFRYRLRRLAEVAGLDLTDPEARFETMLQLRIVPTSL